MNWQIIRHFDTIISKTCRKNPLSPPKKVIPAAQPSNRRCCTSSQLKIQSPCVLSLNVVKATCKNISLEATKRMLQQWQGTCTEKNKVWILEMTKNQNHLQLKLCSNRAWPEKNFRKNQNRKEKYKCQSWNKKSDIKSVPLLNT